MLNLFQNRLEYNPVIMGALLLCCTVMGYYSNAYPADSNSPVKVWEEMEPIPTYPVGELEVNPMFYTHESYQGAEKRIYPYALQENLSNEKQDVEHKMLFLENEYVKLSVLPDLGGRLFSALDKTNGYDFFYRQHVIKPALIGMLGAWMSGGVEWCVFHHHRNTTFMPVDYALAENPDGSKTIWLGELERRHRMKWIIGLTLHPGRSYIEVTVKMFNRTAMPQSILYWANTAVHVNDDYQVQFPPSVQAATYHSKTHFTYWPVSQGHYGSADYTGIDLSWWKNSVSQNSFFAWNLKDDFSGGYDHGKEAGVVHVGNHHILCSAKLWEWGTGTDGRMWDKILTDEDGPYAELMVGGFSDNQPDYSWIKPHEVKEFTQHWYPVRGIGGFKNANLEGAANLNLLENSIAEIGFYATAPHSNAVVSLEADGREVFCKAVEISPAKPFQTKTQIPDGVQETALRVSLTTADGKELVAYQPKRIEPLKELPAPVVPPPAPEEIKTVEELYYAGLRIQQIHNPTGKPMDYYNEALKRDKDDSRTNIVVGESYNATGEWSKAEEHLRRAIKRISIDYTRPANTEAYFQLGIALRGQNRFDEAYDAFYRATWDYAFRSVSYYQLAELSCRKGDWIQALEQVNQALTTNRLDTRSLNLRALILRKTGDVQGSILAHKETQKIDPLNVLALNEEYLVQVASGDSTAPKSLSEFARLTREDVQAYLECATDYMSAGCWEEATGILERASASRLKATRQYPLVHYYLGYLHEKAGDAKLAAKYYQQASEMDSDFCFPFRLETIDVLNAAIATKPKDSLAYYYLGNLLYDTRPEEAIIYWEKSRSLNDGFARIHRNLGWAYYRTGEDIPKAIASYEKAVECDPNDPIYYLELDRLYETGNVEIERRFALFDGKHDIAKKRTRTLLREIDVLMLEENYDAVISCFENFYFHAREGGKNIHDTYVDAHLLKGISALSSGNAELALEHFKEADEYPANLSFGRPSHDRRASQLLYYTGLTHESQGDSAKAQASFEQAVSDRLGSNENSDRNFYRGMCLRKLDRNDEANSIFDGLISEGKKMLSGEETTDFFAKFGEQQSARIRQASALYTIALGLRGKGELPEAITEFQQAIKMNTSHIWARHHLRELVKQEHH